VRTPGCFVANISDELYMPILNVGPQQPSPPKDLECVPKINHQPKQATSNFNTGRDIPLSHSSTLILSLPCLCAHFLV
jgi:hypothetical protein